MFSPDFTPLSVGFSANTPAVSVYRHPVSHLVEMRVLHALSSSSSSWLLSICATKTLESSRIRSRNGSAMLAFTTRGSAPVSSSSMGRIWLSRRSGSRQLGLLTRSFLLEGIGQRHTAVVAPDFRLQDLDDPHVPPHGAGL